MARRRRGGRPRKPGAKRYPDGRLKPANDNNRLADRDLSDEERAKQSDPRNNSAPGRLELQHIADTAAIKDAIALAKSRGDKDFEPPLPGGIPELEKLAGERWAMKLAAYRTKDIRSPSPNARAASLTPSSGPAHGPDWDSLDKKDKQKVIDARSDWFAANKVILDLPQGARIETLLHDTFVRDLDPRPEDVPLMRIGLRSLTLHFCMIGDTRE